MKQKFYPYNELEEHAAGMWRITSPVERDQLVDAAADLMRVPDAFREAMVRAVREWPRSVEAAMTTPALNRRAFMGHAGCCIETGSPEDLTRLAWHSLRPDEQDAANAAADDAIEYWETEYHVQAELFDA
jgi:hypothetical protein